MSYLDRVRRGAALLDQVEPGWHRRIACDRLAMESCDSCILGQLYGDYMFGFRAVLEPFPSTSKFSAADHGFTLRDEEQRITWIAVGQDLDDLRAEVEPAILARFAALADSWRAEVRSREGRPCP